MKIRFLGFDLDTAFFIRFFIILLIFVILYGLYLVLSGILPWAGSEARRTVYAFANRGKSRGISAERGLSDFLQRAGRRIGKYIWLNDIRRAEMEQSLSMTDCALTPEEFVGFAAAAGLLFALPASFFLLLVCLFKLPSVFKTYSFVVMGIGVLQYFLKLNELKKDKKKVVTEIDEELPRFVSFVRTALKTNYQGVLPILERYIARSEHFERELDMTISDIKMSNLSRAMLRFDQRICSENLKKVIQGLISADAGDDVSQYFAMLDADFSSYEVSNLRSKAKEIPRKLRGPQYLLYLAIIAMILVPVVSIVMNSLGDILGGV